MSWRTTTLHIPRLVVLSSPKALSWRLHRAAYRRRVSPPAPSRLNVLGIGDTLAVPGRDIKRVERENAFDMAFREWLERVKPSTQTTSSKEVPGMGMTTVLLKNIPSSLTPQEVYSIPELNQFGTPTGIHILMDERRAKYLRRPFMAQVRYTTRGAAERTIHALIQTKITLGQRTLFPVLRRHPRGSPGGPEWYTWAVTAEHSTTPGTPSMWDEITRLYLHGIPSDMSAPALAGAFGLPDLASIRLYKKSPGLALLQFTSPLARAYAYHYFSTRKLTLWKSVLPVSVCDPQSGPAGGRDLLVFKTHGLPHTPGRGSPEELNVPLMAKMSEFGKVAKIVEFNTFHQVTFETEESALALFRDLNGKLVSLHPPAVPNILEDDEEEGDVFGDDLPSSLSISTSPQVHDVTSVPSALPSLTPTPVSMASSFPLILPPPPSPSPAIPYPTSQVAGVWIIRFPVEMTTSYPLTPPAKIVS